MSAQTGSTRATLTLNALTKMGPSPVPAGRLYGDSLKCELFSRLKVLTAVHRI